jgi:general secretion pathway protein G
MRRLNIGRSTRPVRGWPPRYGTAIKGVTQSAVIRRAPGRALRAYRCARGMTLIEILVVLVLIGIVLGVVGGNFLGRGEKAKADAARIEIGQIGQALDLYKLEIGRYPTTQEGLQALISASTGVTNWNGPYWKRSTIPTDPWGNEYKYASPGQNAPYDIISYGADGKEGGDGVNKDITSSQ